MRKQVRWLVQHVGRRGAFLLFLCVLDEVYGSALLTAPRAVFHASLIFPLPAWGWAWISAGAVCFAGAFARRDRTSFTVAALIKAAWGGVFANLWFKGISGSWQSAAVWFSFAATVILIAGWPESAVPQVPETGPPESAVPQVPETGPPE